MRIRVMIIIVAVIGGIGLFVISWLQYPPLPDDTLVLVIAGQSNADGRGGQLQPFESERGIPAYRLSLDLRWQPLSDPVGSEQRSGSVWTLVASSLVDTLQRPVAFVPVTKGGTNISQWLPGTELYQRLLTRAHVADDAQLVLWWQGETDALEATDGAIYEARLNTLIDAIYADLHVPTMPALLQTIEHDTSAVNDAIMRVWATNPRAVRGPDLRDVISDDEFHLVSTENLQVARLLWVQAILEYIKR